MDDNKKIKIGKEYKAVDLNPAGELVKVLRHYEGDYWYVARNVGGEYKDMGEVIHLWDLEEINQ